VSRTAAARPALGLTHAHLQQHFERAAHAAGGRELRATIAGDEVRLRFASSAAADALSPALAHLARTPAAAPALTLHVWDAASTGTERPAGAPPREDVAGAADDGTGASYFYEDFGLRTLHQPAYDALSVLSDDGVGWYWVPDATALPYWESTAPFRHLLSWWLHGRGSIQVHGGAVGTEAGGVLLVGRGGSGKSTAALASLLDDRLRYVGDDYVAVAIGKTPVVHSLYCHAKVHWRDLGRLPHVEPAIVNAGAADEKAVLSIPGAFPGRTAAGFPLRAIVVPAVTGRRIARTVPAPQAAALAALAPSTIFQLHPPARDSLARMATLVRTTPVYALELGTEIESIPEAFVQLLEEVN